jgi:hypothetical protein
VDEIADVQRELGLSFRKAVAIVAARRKRTPDHVHRVVRKYRMIDRNRNLLALAMLQSRSSRRAPPAVVKGQSEIADGAC